MRGGQPWERGRGAPLEHRAPTALRGEPGPANGAFPQPWHPPVTAEHKAGVKCQQAPCGGTLNFDLKEVIFVRGAGTFATTGRRNDFVASSNQAVPAAMHTQLMPAFPGAG